MRPLMSYWDKIDHPRFFARVRESEVASRMPSDLAPLVDYLVREHGTRVSGLYLENPKSPEVVVVMDRALPLDVLRRAFPGADRLRYTDHDVQSDLTWSRLVGPQG